MAWRQRYFLYRLESLTQITISHATRKKLVLQSCTLISSQALWHTHGHAHPSCTHYWKDKVHRHDFHLPFGFKKEVRQYQSRINHTIGIVIVSCNVIKESAFLVSPGRYPCPRSREPQREPLLQGHPLTVEIEQ